MFDNKLSYKGFKVGQTVKLNTSVKVQEIPAPLKAGYEFIINAFPPCVTYGKHQYFVYGKDNDNNHVRCSIDEISK